jgi:hypothetical protein
MIIDGQTYGIGIMTYSKRKEYIKNLLDDIRRQSEIPVYIAVNCNYGQQFEEDYRSYMLELCSKYTSVFPSFYLKFRGSSKLWNDMIVNTSYDNLIILNDDIRLNNTFIQDFINYKIANNNTSILKVNNGWAGFCVHKNYIKAAGFFNEQYLGIGFEDSEFVRRHGEFPAFMSQDFVDLAYESVSTFPKMENVTNQHDKRYSGYNHALINNGVLGTGINFRPYENEYDEKFNQIF